MDSNVSRQDFRDMDREVTQISHDVTALKMQVSHLNSMIATLVSKAEFFPVKVIVYGLAAGSMGAVMTQVVSSVLVR